jgi:hypothetical protein
MSSIERTSNRPEVRPLAERPVKPPKDLQEPQKAPPPPKTEQPQKGGSVDVKA